MPDWLFFEHNSGLIADIQEQFSLHMGSSIGYLKTISDVDRHTVLIEILSTEALESAKKICTASPFSYRKRKALC